MPGNRPKPLCQAFTRTGAPCRGIAATEQDGRQLCRVHACLVDQAELGRRSAAKRRKRRAGTFVDAIRQQLERDPERHAEKLLASGARGVELATELLAKEEERGREEPVESLAGGWGFADMVAFIARQGSDHERLTFGFELTHEQRAIALERWERGEADRGRDGERVPPARDRWDSSSISPT